MIIDKYLYFRDVADQDDDDGIDNSVYVPARNITGMTPTSATALTIFFKSVYNTQGDGSSDGEDVQADSVIVNFTAGKGKEVMSTIVQAMTSNKLYGDGHIVVADDVTTTYLTSSAAADQTVSAVTLSPYITGCGTITAAAALS